MIKNIMIAFLGAAMTGCSSTEIRNNSGLVSLELKGKVKRLTEFAVNNHDTSVMVKTVRDFDAHGGLISQHIYKNDQLISSLKPLDNKKEFIHEGESNTAEYRYYGKERQMQKAFVSEVAGQKTLFNYDDHNNLIEERNLDVSGQLIALQTYRYDAEGRVQEKNFTTSRPAYGQADYQKYIYTYDAKGNKAIEKCLKADGSIQKEIRYRYAEPETTQASLLPQPEDCSDTTLYQFAYCEGVYSKIPATFSFDVKGNWTKRTGLDKYGNVMSVTARVIEYYGE